jgi:hypothetical protein
MPMYPLRLGVMLEFCLSFSYANEPFNLSKTGERRNVQAQSLSKHSPGWP